MLHQPTNPPQIVARPRRARRAVKSALDVIDANIQPIETDSGSDLLDALCWMKDENDVIGMIELYEAYADSAERLAFGADRAEGRASKVISDECCQAWAKAYLVADFMKQMRPSRWMAERYAHALFDAAYRMGGTLEEAAAVLAEIASWELEAPLPPSMVR